MTTLTPYLIFHGDCAEAMEFYQDILGGDLSMQQYGEAGMPATTEEQKDKIIHAYLKNGQSSFMASDDAPGNEVKVGNNVHMSVTGTDEGQLTDYFNKLAGGGKIDMPLEKQFWGDTFGMLTDKFGVHWMVNISKGEEKT